MTESRPRLGELISAGCALALLILLLATAWYGVAGVPDPTYTRPAVSGTETGWGALPDVRWVIVLTAIVAVGTVVLRISQREHGRQTDATRLVTTLGLLCSALLIYRVLIVLPSPDKVLDQKLGALLGLACALGIALGGHESILERRSRPQTVSHRPGRRATPGLSDQSDALDPSDPLDPSDRSDALDPSDPLAPSDRSDSSVAPRAPDPSRASSSRPPSPPSSRRWPGRTDESETR